MENKFHVLVVDDEPAILDLLSDFLAADGFHVETATNGEEALIALQRHRVDCLILDVRLPGISGFDLCRRVRATSDVPILFLSARGDDMDKVRGLGLGGDDYIVKSVTPAEIVARVKAVLRRARGSDESGADVLLDFGHLIIDMRAREVRVDGKSVAMTAREFELLAFLAMHPRQVFTRDQLFERFWGDFGDRHTLTVHIGHIREKIESSPDQPPMIITVWGVGYRFEGTLQRSLHS
jgi:DNA-binding response OmpR family regulator